MTLRLQRGQKGDVNSTPLVTNILVGVGWDNTDDTPEDYIIDLVMYGLNSDGYCRRKKDIIYFYNPVLEGERCDIITHLEPTEIVTSPKLVNVDKEQIRLILDEIPERIDKILVGLGIYDSLKNGYNLGQIKNLHLQIVNEENLEILIENEPYTKDYFKNESFVILGELFRYGNQWRYHNLSKGYIGDIGTLHGLYLREENEIK